MVPVAQSILADSFPPAKRGQAFALFGVAVVVAPVVGPTLGGWLADNFSWHWCFLINGPVGVLAIALIALILREPEAAAAERQQLQAARAGSISSASCWSRPFSARSRSCSTAGSRTTGSAHLSSSQFAAVCALAFVLMIPWEISRRNPMIDLRMVATRQFGACFVVMLATGAILLATTQFLPQLVQQDFGYTATWAGLVLSPGGVVTMVMMFVVGRLSAKVQPKYLIVVGAVIIALSMYDLTNVYGDLGFWFFARSRMLLGVGLPLIFLPIIAASYDGIPPDKTDQASALINAARNTGGSIGISLVSNVLGAPRAVPSEPARRAGIPSSVQYQDTLHQVTNYFAAQGSLAGPGTSAGHRWIGQQVQAQASFLAYMDAFWVLMLISLAAVPLALALRKVKLGGAAMAH